MNEDPPAIKDLSDLVEAKGPGAVLEAIENAKVLPHPDEGTAKEPDDKTVAIDEKTQALFDRAEELIASGRSLAAISKTPIDTTKTLLGDRWLCRGARAGIIIAPTGVGKSVVANQAAAQWSIGVEAFGIAPSMPLRVMIIQAENDEGDEIEATSGIFKHFEFSDGDVARIEKGTISMRLRGLTDMEFLAMLRKLCELWNPDLVMIDPLGVFLGDDPKDTKAVVQFFDGPNGLNVIAENLDIGILCVAHTPKTNFRDTSKWTATDWAYSMEGCAKIAASSGSTITIDQADESGNIYRFIAGKRAKRTGWRDSEGEWTREKYFKHGDDGIYWQESDASEVENERRESDDEKVGAILAEVIEKVGAATHPDFGDGIADKTRLISSMKGQQAARQVINDAVICGDLFEFEGYKGKKSLTADRATLDLARGMVETMKSEGWKRRKS